MLARHERAVLKLCLGEHGLGLVQLPLDELATARRLLPRRSGVDLLEDEYCGVHHLCGAGRVGVLIGDVHDVCAIAGLALQVRDDLVSRRRDRLNQQVCLIDGRFDGKN